MLVLPDLTNLPSVISFFGWPWGCSPFSFSFAPPPACCSTLPAPSSYAFTSMFLIPGSIYLFFLVQSDARWVQGHGIGRGIHTIPGEHPRQRWWRRRRRAGGAQQSKTGVGFRFRWHHQQQQRWLEDCEAGVHLSSRRCPFQQLPCFHNSRGWNVVFLFSLLV